MHHQAVISERNILSVFKSTLIGFRCFPLFLTLFYLFLATAHLFLFLRASDIKIIFELNRFVLILHE